MATNDFGPLKRIVVRSPNWLGDAVMALPAVKALHETLAPERLCVLAREGLGGLYRRYPFVDEVVEFRPDEETAAHRSLKGKGFAAFILFTNSFRSAWNARKSSCPVRAGFEGNFRSLLLTHPVKRPRGVHMTVYYMELARFFGASDAAATMGFPIFPEEETFAARFPSAKAGVGIPLGARYGSAKRWPAENVAEFVRLVVEKTPVTAVLFGTMHESAQAEELAGAHGERVINLAGKTTIGEMAAVMGKCGWIVANDSGPAHLAALAGAKTVALFGSTDPSITAPLGGNVTIIRGRAECSPCFKRECPTDFRCMKGITGEDVFRAIS